MSTRRLRLDLGYDGADFRGWATQLGLHTIQSEVEAALAMASHENVIVTVAGRTDTGAHTCHQICYADISETAWTRLSSRGRESDEQAMISAIVRQLNRILFGRYGGCIRGHDLATVRDTCDACIYSTVAADPNFDVCFSAFGRSYVYRMPDHSESLECWDRLWVEGSLDEAAMNEAGAALPGEHDFSGFCRLRGGATMVRTLHTLSAERDAEGTLVFRVEADAFYHSMIRSLVGALLLMGSGIRGIAYPMQILRAWSRSEAAPTAPTYGLTLEGVEYPDPSQWRARAEQAQVRCDTCCDDDG